MYYCSHCYLLNQTDCCGRCGAQPLAQVKGSDFCYLTTQSAPWTQMLQEVLDNNAISCTQRLVPGAWATAYLGSSPRVKTEFFVPYEKLAEAQALVQELFAAEPCAPEEE